MKTLRIIKEILALAGVMAVLTIGYVMYSQTGSIVEKASAAANGVKNLVVYDNSLNGEFDCAVGWENSICHINGIAIVIPGGMKEQRSLPTRILTAPIDTAKDAYKAVTGWFGEGNAQ